MPTNVIMPQMGESIFEGTLTRWLKKPGDKVARDEPLFEISTDKVDAEIPSPAAGVLGKVMVNEGQTVQINTVVAQIVEEGEAVSEGGGEAAAAPPQERPAGGGAEALPQARAEAPGKSQPPPAGQGRRPETSEPVATAEAAAPLPGSEEPRAGVAEFPRGGGQADGESGAGAEDVRSSPLVRKLAAEHNVDLAQIKGTGIGGRVTKQDILNYVEQRGGKVAAPAAPPRQAQPTGVPSSQPKPAPAAPQQPAAAPAKPAQPAPAASRPAGAQAGGRVEVVPMSTMRQKIAEHMVHSKHTSAHVHTVFQIDMTRVVRLREQMKAEFEQRNGVKLTYMPFIARAAVNALQARPYINSSIDGTNVLLKKEIHLGIAVALDWGLIVPVIKNAEEKNIVGLARAIRDLADRARNKKLLPDEVQGGTFTITNPGTFGALFGTPIISQPQVAILGVGAINKVPVVTEDDAIAIRSIVHLTLGYDHRLIDGAEADQFMLHVKKTLENWEEPIQ